MKKINIIYTFIISAFFSSHAIAKPYGLPNDFDQYEKTGSCVRCDLSGRSLRSYTNADLRSALLVEANLVEKTYYTSNFSNAIMNYSRMSHSLFSGSNFSGTQLIDADMKWSNFSSSNFENANLSGADLSYADLAWSKITTEQLAQAKTYACAILPNGVKAPSADGKPC